MMDNWCVMDVMGRLVSIVLTMSTVWAVPMTLRAVSRVNLMRMVMRETDVVSSMAM